MVDWKDYGTGDLAHVREKTEWTVRYDFDYTDTEHPRVLLIGDSICHAYNGVVREKLKDRVNVSFWASSRCVSDPMYLRELAFVLDFNHYDMISFNNGLHSLKSDRAHWIKAFGNTLDFIRDHSPETLLSVTLSTPLTDPALTKISAELNEAAKEAAEKRGLPMIDLFTPMDALDRSEFWTDVYHFKPAAVEIQAKIIAEHVADRLGR